MTRLAQRTTVLTAGLIASLGLCAALSHTSAGQDRMDNPVYVDDSSRAAELIRRALEQREDNIGETVRTFQELLDDHGSRLLPIRRDRPDQFMAVRTRILQELRHDADLLQRYQMIQTPAAARLLAAGEYTEVVRTRVLTEPGLEGLMRLAQHHLDHGQLDHCSARLDEARTHPARTREHDARIAFMTGLIAHFRGDEDLVQHTVEYLDTLEGRAYGELASALRRIAARPIVSRWPEVANALEPFNHLEPDAIVSHPIWSAQLRDGPYGRRFSDRIERGEQPDRIARATGRMLTMLPTLAGSDVFINQGHSVVCYDRYSQRLRWEYVERPRGAIIDNDREIPGDLSSVAVAYDLLVTLTGYAYSDARSNNGKIVALDANSGRFLWRTILAEQGHGDELEGLFPHGQPIIAEDRVYVLARRLSRQNVTSTYLAALDAANGDLVWIRHLGSSGGLRQVMGRPFSSPIYDRGKIFVESSVGVVSMIDATTGNIDWLVRYSVPISPMARSRMPWEISSPLLLHDRVYVIEQGQANRLAVYERNTGDLVHSQPVGSGVALGAARYLVGHGDFLYAIGDEVRSFHIDEMGRPSEEPIWTFPARDTRRILDDETVSIFGRVQIGEQLIVIPTNQGQYMLDRETGAVIKHLPAAVGNPLAADGQLFVTGLAELSSFMPLHIAEEMIARRMESMGNDPEPAMTLIELGLRAGDADLSLDGARAALAIMSAMEEDEVLRSRAEQTLFSLLLEVHALVIDDPTGPRSAGHELHDMLESLATDETRILDQRLARAQWLAGHSPADAISVYRSILNDDDLSGFLRQRDDLIRPAWAWVHEGLVQLLNSDPDLITQLFADAEKETTDASPGGPPGGPPGVLTSQDTERLRSLIRRFPMMVQTVDAVIDHVELLQRQGDHFEAMQLLSSAWRQTAPFLPDESPRLLGRLAESLAEGSGNHATVDFLQWTQRRIADRDLKMSDRTERPSQWIARLVDRPAKPTSLRAGVDQIVEQPGTVMTPSARHRPSRTGPTGLHSSLPGILLRDDDTVRLIDSAEFAADVRRGGPREGSPRWEAEVETPVELLTLDDRGVLLWLSRHGVDPRALMLDLETGREQWITSRLNDLFDDMERLLEPGASPGRLLPDGRPFDLREVVPIVSDDVLILVRRTGSAACFDINSGRLLWTDDGFLHEVHLATANTYGLVLTGTQRIAGRGGRTVLGGAAVILDPMTGDVRHTHRTHDGASIRSIAMTPIGTAALLSDSGLECVDLLSGELLWLHDSMTAREAIVVASVDDAFVTASSENVFTTWDGLTGRKRTTLGQDLGRLWNRSPLVDILPIGDDVFIHLREQLVRFRTDGRIEGLDMVTDARQYRAVIPVTDGLVVVNQQPSHQAQVEGEIRPETVYPYVIYLMAEDCRVIDEMTIRSAGRPVREQVVSGSWLVLSTQDASYFILLE